MSIPIGKQGIIVSGEDAGSSIFIEAEPGGGFLILVDRESQESGYDGWVADLPSLEGYFREAGWVVNWTSE